MNEEEEIKVAKSFYGINELEANFYLRRAAKLGSGNAFYELAKRYAIGVPMNDTVEAEKCLREASRLGSMQSVWALRLYRELLAEHEKPIVSCLTEAIKRGSEVDDWEPFEQLRLMSGLNDPLEYDSSDVLFLKQLASIGDVCAAFDLAEGYDSGQLNDEFEPEPLESLRWSLIENYLWGYSDWIERTISENERENADHVLILNEVRAWIDSHPMACLAADREWYKRRFLETGGNVPEDDLSYPCV